MKPWGGPLLRLSTSPCSSAMMGKGSSANGTPWRVISPFSPLNWQDPMTQETFEGFREKGYLPSALMNFLALLGWHPSGNQEFFDHDALCAQFSIGRIHKAGVRCDLKKATWLNQQHLRAMPNEAIVAQYLEPALKANHITTHLDLLKVAELIKQRTTFPKDLWAAHAYLFVPPTTYPMEHVQRYYASDIRPLLATIAEALAVLTPFHPEAIKQTITQHTQAHQCKPRQIIPLLRLALTATTHGPNLPEMIAVLGTTEVNRRLQQALATWGVKPDGSPGPDAH